MGKIIEKLKRSSFSPVTNVLRKMRNVSRIQKMKEEIATMSNRIEEISLNLQNINAIIPAKTDMLSSDLEKMGSNIRNINAIIPAKTDMLSSDLEKVESNIRNINAIIPAKTDALSQDFERLAINVRNNTAQIAQIEYLETKINALERKLERSVAKIPISEGSEQKNLRDDIKKKETEVDMPYEVVDYFDFENHFRGTREQIKEVQKQYLPYFKDCQRVLDLGCGRGEFLELLQQEGIDALGIDIYEDYVEYCKAKGMLAIHDDAVHYLGKIEKSVDGIFIGQVVEHLKLEEMVELCNLVYEKLNIGGCAIFETPNPTSLAIYTHAFYLDPSHTKPVHPLTLKYFLEKAGFKSIEIVYTESSKIEIEIPPIKTEQNEESFNLAMQEVQKLLFGSQDYAIIAKKY